MFTPDELDAEWKRLADENNPDSTDMARSLNARFQQICQTYESQLAELRDLARMSLAEQAERERQLSRPAPSAGADALHDVEVDPETGRLLH